VIKQTNPADNHQIIEKQGLDTLASDIRLRVWRAPVARQAVLADSFHVNITDPPQQRKNISPEFSSQKLFPRQSQPPRICSKNRAFMTFHRQSDRQDSPSDFAAGAEYGNRTNYSGNLCYSY
jgi:hypothetical protein